MAEFIPITNTTPRYGVWSGECTSWVVHRSSQAFGVPCMTSYDNANTWMDKGSLGSQWVRLGGSPVPGDVVVLDDNHYGHVLFVETSNIITQSNVWNPDGSGPWYHLWADQMSYDTFHSPGHKYFSCVNRSSYDGYLSMSYIGRLHYNGAGGGGTNPDEPPDEPPTPGAKGEWVWHEGETVEVITTSQYTYTDRYECGVGTFGDQSGTQDDPQAPTLIHPKGDRLNERWEPFNMYTDERILTYTSDGKPIWSNWETKYTGSDNFPLGSQPTYGNGWEMEWQGDDD